MCNVLVELSLQYFLLSIFVFSGKKKKKPSNVDELIGGLISLHLYDLAN
jgi:hypothetical protein